MNRKDSIFHSNLENTLGGFQLQLRNIKKKQNIASDWQLASLTVGVFDFAGAGLF